MLSAKRQPKPILACFEGLTNTPLTRFTPLLSSSACTKTWCLSPALIDCVSSQTRLSVGPFESELADVTRKLAFGGSPCPMFRLTLLPALSEIVRYFTVQI